MRRRGLIGLASLATLALAACGDQQAGETAATSETPAGEEAPRFANVDDERLHNAALEPAQWLTYGGTYAEQRFSQLDQVNTENVGELGLAWYADYEGKGARVMQEGTPLFIDGVLYVSTAWSNIYAYDARTGEQLWHYDPEVPLDWAVNVCCGLVNRGIAAYEGKIYIGTLDGRLIAVDAETGAEVWSEMTIDQAWP
jgi:glucose dehydrogenase